MGFLRLLESVRIPALNVFFSGITYCGDEIAFMVVAFALFWCVNKRTAASAARPAGRSANAPLTGS